jgi:hypothetical protein
MFHAIMMAVIDSTIDSMCPFLCDGNPVGDLTSLVCFTLNHPGRWISRRTVQSELAAGRLIQPLALPRNGHPRRIVWQIGTRPRC